MREILFRGKTCNGEWVQGLLANKDDKWFISNKAGIPFAYEVRPETICQFTGLTDKNGVKIWENDICNCVYNGRLATRVIVWDKSELDFKGTNGKEKYGREYDYLICCEELEVIGNIFDNPELMEGGGSDE